LPVGPSRRKKPPEGYERESEGAVCEALPERHKGAEIRAARVAANSVDTRRRRGY